MDDVSDSSSDSSLSECDLTRDFCDCWLTPCCCPLGRLIWGMPIEYMPLMEAEAMLADCMDGRIEEPGGMYMCGPAYPCDEAPIEPAMRCPGY